MISALGKQPQIVMHLGKLSHVSLGTSFLVFIRLGNHKAQRLGVLQTSAEVQGCACLPQAKEYSPFRCFQPKHVFIDSDV